MTKAIIIEDEKPALDLLVKALSESATDIHIEAVISSVAEGKKYMAGNPAADIIFSDVQLTDGYSFEIFKNANSRIPVIFITGYNEFMMNAFASNGINYLLKPVSIPDIRNALHKYYMLKEHFSEHDDRFDNLIRHFQTRKKSRMIVRRGIEHIAIKIEDIVLIYTENKMVYLIDKNGKKYMADKNLSELELELDDTVFFRANRQYIININFINGFKPYEKVKLFVDVSLPEPKHTIIISQEHAPEFRKWIYEI